MFFVTFVAVAFPTFPPSAPPPVCDLCSPPPPPTCDLCTPPSPPTCDLCTPPSPPTCDLCTPPSPPTCDLCTPPSPPTCDLCAPPQLPSPPAPSSPPVCDLCSPPSPPVCDLCSPPSPPTCDLCAPPSPPVCDLCAPPASPPFTRDFSITTRISDLGKTCHLVGGIIDFCVSNSMGVMNLANTQAQQTLDVKCFEDSVISSVTVERSIVSLNTTTCEDGCQQHCSKGCFEYSSSLTFTRSISFLNTAALQRLQASLTSCITSGRPAIVVENTSFTPTRRRMSETRRTRKSRKLQSTCGLTNALCDQGSCSASSCTSVPYPPPSPPSAPVSFAKMQGDPHIRFAHGGIADFRGVNNTLYNLLSAPSYSFSGRTMDTDFMLPRPLLVHGSFFTQVVWLLNTGVSASSAQYRITADASVTGFVVRHQSNDSIIAKKLGVWQEWTQKGIRVYQKQSTVYVRANGWEVNATRKPIYNYINGPSMWRYDIAIRPLDGSTGFESHYGKASLTCAPHGIIGQSWDNDDIAVNGALDDYKVSRVHPEMRTKALAEGAIEGISSDYRILDDKAFNFRFSRYSAHPMANCKPRNVTKLTGVKIKKKGNQVASTTEISEMPNFDMRI